LNEKLTEYQQNADAIALDKFDKLGVNETPEGRSTREYMLKCHRLYYRADALVTKNQAKKKTDELRGYPEPRRPNDVPRWPMDPAPRTRLVASPIIPAAGIGVDFVRAKEMFPYDQAPNVAPPSVSTEEAHADFSGIPLPARVAPAQAFPRSLAPGEGQGNSLPEAAAEPEPKAIPLPLPLGEGRGEGLLLPGEGQGEGLPILATVAHAAALSLPLPPGEGRGEGLLPPGEGRGEGLLSEDVKVESVAFPTPDAHGVAELQLALLPGDADIEVLEVECGSPAAVEAGHSHETNDEVTIEEPRDKRVGLADETTNLRNEPKFDDDDVIAKTQVVEEVTANSDAKSGLDSLGSFQDFSGPLSSDDAERSSDEDYSESGVAAIGENGMAGSNPDPEVSFKTTQANPKHQIQHVNSRTSRRQRQARKAEWEAKQVKQTRALKELKQSFEEQLKAGKLLNQEMILDLMRSKARILEIPLRNFPPPS
jgi:hypothetical protein